MGEKQDKAARDNENSLRDEHLSKNEGRTSVWDEAFSALEKTALGLKEERDRLLKVLEAAKLADCECTVRERNSGHRVGCWAPALYQAIRAALKSEKQ